MDKYKHSKIYKLYGEDGAFYYGSSIEKHLSKRYWCHRTMAQQFPDRRVYKHYNTLGWDKVKIVLVEAFECSGREELRKKENEYIVKSLDDTKCLNHHLAFLTDEVRQEKRVENQRKCRAEASPEEKEKRRMRHNELQKIRRMK